MPPAISERIARMEQSGVTTLLVAVDDMLVARSESTMWSAKRARVCLPS